MRLEMDGKEPLVIFLGIPTLTALILFLGAYCGRNTVLVPEVRTIVQPTPVQPAAVTITPEITAKVTLPAREPIHVQVTPEILARVTMPEGSVQIQNLVPVPKVDVNINTGATAPGLQAPVKEETDPFAKEGKLLPPPRDSKK